MGLLKHLLFWPVTGPSFLTRFSLQKVEGAVRSELTDDTAVKSDLMELQLRLEMGDIDDEEYVRREAELMRRLREAREWRERFGMATAGGVVRVAEEAREDEAAGERPGEGEGPTEAEAADGERRPQVASADEAEIEIVLDFEEE